MKKMLALLLAAMMCLALVACGDSSQGGTTPNENNSQTNNEGNGDTTDIVATLDVAYLTGVWVLQEQKSAGLTSVRSFELFADGTGKFLASIKEEYLGATFEWSIIDDDVKLVANNGFGYYYLTLEGNELMDWTASDFFAKEAK